LSVTHYNNELGEVVEYEMLDPQCLAEMTPLQFRLHILIILYVTDVDALSKRLVGDILTNSLSSFIKL